MVVTAHPADLLVRAAYVLPMTGAGSTIRDGALAIKDGRIAAVGPASDVARLWTSPEVMDVGDAAVIPGFVDVHAHVPQTFLRGRQSGVFSARPFLPFLVTDLISDDQVYTFGLVGCLEALRYGTTTIQASFTSMAALARAVMESGIRAVLAEEICDMDYAAAAYGRYVRLPGQAYSQLAKAADFADDWHGQGDGRVQAALAPLAPDLVTPETYRAVVRSARDRGIGVVTHAAQSSAEVRQVAMAYHAEPIRHLNELGVQGRDTILAHCIYVSPPETESIRRSDTAIAHCPRGFLLDGITAPLAGWLAAGIRVGLGTDDVDHSMWEAMLAARYAAAIRGDTQLTGYQLLDLATRGGAAVMGMEGKIGQLLPGAHADLQVIAVDGPEIALTADLAESLVVHGPANIRKLMVDGRVVYGPGRQTTLNMSSALERAQEESGRLWRLIDGRVGRRG